MMANAGYVVMIGAKLNHVSMKMAGNIMPDILSRLTTRDHSLMYRYINVNTMTDFLFVCLFVCLFFSYPAIMGESERISVADFPGM